MILPLDADLPHKVKLAKAEIRGVTTDVPSEDLGTDDTSHATLLPKAPVGAQNAPAAPAPAASTAVASEAKPAATPAQTVGAVVDTRTHAFDPLVGAIDNNTNHAVGSAASAHALDSDNEDGPAPVAAAPAAKTPAQIAAAPVQKTAAPIAAASVAETPALVVAAPKAETPAPAAFIIEFRRPQARRRPRRFWSLRLPGRYLHLKRPWPPRRLRRFLPLPHRWSRQRPRASRLQPLWWPRLSRRSRQ